MEEVKNMLRSVLLSAKEGIPAHVLQRDYREVTLEPLPFRKFGFNNLDDFIGSIPDVVTIRRNRTGEIMYHAVANEETQHIKNMVSKQRSAKKKRHIKPASRRPRLPMNFRPPPLRPRPNRTSRKPPSPGQYFTAVPFNPSSPPNTGSPMQPANFKVVVNRGGNHRSVVSSSGMGRALFGAMDAANKERQTPRTYEVPPRFRRLQEEQQAPPPAVRSQVIKINRPPSSPRKEKLTVETVTDGEKYMRLVTNYLESKNALPLKFETIPSKMNNRDFYACSLKIDGEVYGSEDIFGTRRDAEYAVCRNICNKLNLLGTDRQVTLDLSIPEDDLKSRVKEILFGKTNGVWSTRLPVVYQEIFQEEAPSNIVDLVRKWKDIARVEGVANTGRDIIYPVLEDPDKNKDLKIPPAEPLPLMEEVTIYVTNLSSCGHFCVQREDSSIDEVGAEIERVTKQKHIPSPEFLIEGCHCAALFEEDKSWSRAEILSVSEECRSDIRVMFVDYGNMESCHAESTRWLTEKAARYPAQAVNCYLRGVYYLDSEDDWSKESTHKFAEIVQEKALIAITHAYDENGFCEVDLFLANDPSISVNQKLIDDGLVKNLLLPDQPLGAGDYNGVTFEPAPLVYPSEEEWDVYVSFVNTSTESVMMRLVGEEYSEKLDELEFCLEEAFHEAPEDDTIEVGMVCVAFVETLYHRVRVMGIEEKWIECYFLDHGDTDKFIKDQLRVLDPKINCTLPYQGFETSLYGLEEVSQNSAALEKLFDVALGKTCVAEIVSREEPLSVILYDTSGTDDLNINDTIMKTVNSEAESSLYISSQGLSNVSKSSRDTSPSVNSVKISPNSKKSVSPNYSKSDLKTDSKMDNKELQIESVKVTEIVSEDKKEDSDSWETASEDEREVIKVENEDRTEVTKTDHNFNVNIDISDSVPKKSLYTWDTKTKTEKSSDEEDKLWNPTYYHRYPVPPPFSLPPVGEFCDLHVSFVFDPTNFVCNPYETITELNELHQEMFTYFNSVTSKQELKDEDLKLGHLYAGEQNGFWYRILINKIINTGLVSVYNVDYGEYNAMTLDEIRPLPWIFWKLPQQAFKGKLIEIQPAGGAQVWSEAAKYKMTQMAQDRNLVGLVCGVDDSGVVSLKLVDTSLDDEDICLHEELLASGFAEPLATPHPHGQD